MMNNQSHTYKSLYFIYKAFDNSKQIVAQNIQVWIEGRNACKDKFFDIMVPRFFGFYSFMLIATNIDYANFCIGDTF